MEDVRVDIEDVDFYYSEHKPLGSEAMERSLSFVEVAYKIKLNSQNWLSGIKSISALEYDEEMSFKELKTIIKEEVLESRN